MVLREKLDQCNRIESSEISQHLLVIRSFKKQAKAIQWNKNEILNKLFWSNCISTLKKKKESKQKTLPPSPKLAQDRL